MNSTDKSAALAIICTINAVEGFDPTPLAVDYVDLNTGEKRKRLPVMAQVAWFRLKYPEGRFTLSVAAVNDYFVATARVYRNYMDPIDCYLSEATASRGYLPDKPTVSPREWAQTAALGIALRNAGFGLQFHAAGDSFDEPAVSEFGDLIGTNQEHGIETGSALPPEQVETDESSEPAVGESGELIETKPTPDIKSGTELLQEQVETGESYEPSEYEAEEPQQTDEESLEAALKVLCPIKKHSDKTLGEMITIDPGAIVWVATKFSGDPKISAAAKLICDRSLAATA